MIPPAASSPAAAHPGYRADIDGLRAVAVLAVLAFHVAPRWLPAGFVGVDIFFALSGFLITGIILDGLTQQRFSFAGFYRRRIRRIFPALAIVLAASFALAWAILLPREMVDFARHAFAGAGFFANFQLLHEHGYFNPAADTRPLLHLWSLAIEEQFYIVWPPLLWLAWRLRLPPILVIAAVFVASLGFELTTMQVNSETAFYLPQARVWELAAGGLLAAALRRFPAAMARLSGDWASASGGLLILVGLLLTPRDRFPGLWPLLPVAGTLLLIATGPRGLLNRLLAQPVPIQIGLISYPLYLWHWPLLCFARILASHVPAPGIRLAILALAFVLAWLTTRLIETPLRFGHFAPAKAAALLAAMVALGFGSRSVSLGTGLVHRDVVALNAGTDGGDLGGLWVPFLPGCGIAESAELQLFSACSHDSREPPRYALIGDSKAEALLPGLAGTSVPGGRWLMIGGAKDDGSQVPVLSDDPIYPPLYRREAEAVITAMAAETAVQRVVIAVAARTLLQLGSEPIETLPASPNYAVARQALGATVDKLLDAGKSVTLLIDNPALPRPEDCLGRRSSLAWLDVLLVTPAESAARCHPTIAAEQALQARYRAVLADIAAAGRGRVTLFDPIPYLCDAASGTCPATMNRHRLYKQTDHISDYASTLVGKPLNDFLAQDGIAAATAP